MQKGVRGTKVAEFEWKSHAFDHMGEGDCLSCPLPLDPPLHHGRLQDFFSMGGQIHSLSQNFL